MVTFSSMSEQTSSSWAPCASPGAGSRLLSPQASEVGSATVSAKICLHVKKKIWSDGENASQNKSFHHGSYNWMEQMHADLKQFRRTFNCWHLTKNNLRVKFHPTKLTHFEIKTRFENHIVHYPMHQKECNKKRIFQINLFNITYCIVYVCAPCRPIPCLTWTLATMASVSESVRMGPPVKTGPPL